jgi:hypothetical protein
LIVPTPFRKMTFCKPEYPQPPGKFSGTRMFACKQNTGNKHKTQFSNERRGDEHECSQGRCRETQTYETDVRGYQSKKESANSKAENKKRQNKQTHTRTCTHRFDRGGAVTQRSGTAPPKHADCRADSPSSNAGPTNSMRGNKTNTRKQHVSKARKRQRHFHPTTEMKQQA